jgi:Phosphoesterase family
LGEANDQHPPHDVQAGEQLIAEVYNAVRNSPAWNDTLLIVQSVGAQESSVSIAPSTSHRCTVFAQVDAKVFKSEQSPGRAQADAHFRT